MCRIIWVNLSNYLSEKRGHVKSWIMCQCHHSYIQSRVHSRYKLYIYYEETKKENISYAFEQLIYNLKIHNRTKL